MSLNRTQSGHHMSHLSITEGNLVASKQRLQREVRKLYRLIDQDASEEAIQNQRYVVRICESIIERLPKS